MAWSALIVSDMSGQPLGQVSNPYDRTVAWRRNGVTTCSFRLRLDDPLGDLLLSGHGMVKLYNDTWGTAPAFVGEVYDAEETVERSEKTVAVTAYDAAMRLSQRMVGQSAVGDTVTADTDRGQIVLDRLAGHNAEETTGLRAGATGVSSSTVGGPWYFKPMSELLSDMASPLDGFEWWVEPVEPTSDAQGLYWGLLNIAAVRGSAKPNAVFAFSDSRDDRGNVASYQRQVSKQSMVNQMSVLPPGFPDTAQGTVQIWRDYDSIAEWGIRDAVLSPADVADDTLRLKLAQQHVAVRKGPRETVQFSGVIPEQFAATYPGAPIPATPRFRTDYDVGDLVPFRASVDGQVRVDAVLRVYGVSLSISNSGVETPTLTLVSEGGA